MFYPTKRTTGRVVILTTALLLLGATLGGGLAAAHNPACHQTAGADGPHYGGDVSSDTAFEKNPTLNGDANPGVDDDRWAGGCSVGNSQSPNSDN